jgi:hypothetical protein
MVLLKHYSCPLFAISFRHSLTIAALKMTVELTRRAAALDNLLLGASKQLSAFANLHAKTVGTQRTYLHEACLGCVTAMTALVQGVVAR